jgi:hypothetical protein
LEAAQGRVDIGSMALGMVSLDTNPDIANPGWKLGYKDVNNVNGFGDVSLSGRSLLNISGVNAGSIQVQGRQINILGGSVLIIINAKKIVDYLLKLLQGWG